MCMYHCHVGWSHVEADAIAPSKFQSDMAAIDERLDAILRDARGFTSSVLRSAWGSGMLLPVGYDTLRRYFHVVSWMAHLACVKIAVVS